MGNAPLHPPPGLDGGLVPVRVLRRGSIGSSAPHPRAGSDPTRPQENPCPQHSMTSPSGSFVAECPIPNDLGPILVPGERPYIAYKTFRDSAIFTDRRLIVRDSQGITGKKVELYSLPYSRIDMWSSENAGHLGPQC